MSAYDKLQSDYQRYIQNVETQAKADIEKIRTELDALKSKAAEFKETA